MEPIKIFCLKDPNTDEWFPSETTMNLGDVELTSDDLAKVYGEEGAAWHSIWHKRLTTGLEMEANRKALTESKDSGFERSDLLLEKHYPVTVIERWEGPAFGGQEASAYWDSLPPMLAKRIFNELWARAYPMAAMHPDFGNALKLKRAGYEAKAGAQASDGTTSIPE